MNRTRLDAESVRDALLQIAGKLDTTMGGPSVKQFIQSPGIHVTPKVDYLRFDVDSPESYRRSVYRFLFRTLPDPFMDSMDCPDSSQLSPKRNASVTALQALAMLNDRFIVRQCEHFAARVAGLRRGHPLPGRGGLPARPRPPPDRDEAEAVAAFAHAPRHGQRLPADREQQRVHVCQLDLIRTGICHDPPALPCARAPRPPRVPLALGGGLGGIALAHLLGQCRGPGR